MIEYTELDRKQRQPRGLHDRGQIFINCRDCKRQLLEIQITANHDDLRAIGSLPITTKIACRCRMCGGVSEVTHIEGSFVPGVANGYRW